MRKELTDKLKDSPKESFAKIGKNYQVTRVNKQYRIKTQEERIADAMREDYDEIYGKPEADT